MRHSKGKSFQKRKGIEKMAQEEWTRTALYRDPY